MRIRTWKHLVRLQLAILYGLATLLLPFAHQPMRANAADLSAYTLADGTVPNICSSTQGTPSGKAAKTQCDACRLTSAPGLLTADLSSVILRMAAPLSAPIPDEQVPHIELAYSPAQPRAPPILTA